MEAIQGLENLADHMVLVLRNGVRQPFFFIAFWFCYRFVRKPFIESAPDSSREELEIEPWYSGELLCYQPEYLGNYEVPLKLEGNEEGIYGFVNVMHMREIDRKRIASSKVGIANETCFKQVISAIERNLRDNIDT